jgi:outer membrane protein assembly factor BamB
MKIKFDIKKYAITSLMIVIFLSSLVLWISVNPTKDFIENVPGMDKTDAVAKIEKKEVKIGEFFTKGSGVSSKINGSFARFRGANFDNIVMDDIPTDWNVNKPEKIWEISLGEGYSSPVVIDGRVYILDYDEKEKSDALLCLSLDDGQLIWKRSYKVPVKRNHGMSRTVCAVDGSYVVSIGPRCHVMCTDAKTGDLLWGIDLVKNFGATEPLWYTGQCPLIDNGVAVIAVGGQALLIGVDCKTGKTLWQTPNPGNWKMTHSSIMRMTVDGSVMYVYTATGGVIGVDVNGKVLWKTEAWAHSIIVPSPVYCGNGRIFLTAGYGAGSMILKVARTDTGYKVDQITSYKPDQGLASEQQTPIFYNDFIYGINPDDGGTYKNQLVCSDINGKILWGSGVDNKFGLGPFIIVGDKIILLTEGGELFLIEADGAKFKMYGEMKMIDGIEAWAPLCYTGGRLLARDSKHLVCLKIK